MAARSRSRSNVLRPPQEESLSELPKRGPRAKPCGTVSTSNGSDSTLRAAWCESRERACAAAPAAAHTWRRARAAPSALPPPPCAPRPHRPPRAARDFGTAARSPSR
eukprot:2521221-Prymnesium_polylepis.1